MTVGCVVRVLIRDDAAPMFIAEVHILGADKRREVYINA